MTAAIARRRSWLTELTRSEPADRAAAEHAITELYGLVGAAPPGFAWVDSPAAAAAVVTPLPRLAVIDPGRVDVRLANLMSDVVHAAERRHRSPHQGMWLGWSAGVGSDDPIEQVRAGLDIGEVLGSAIRRPLDRLAHDQILSGVRDAVDQLPPARRLGQHDAGLVAFLDELLRADVLRPSHRHRAALDAWTALVRSSGWWWPRDGVCVVAERPVATRVEPVGADEFRLHAADGPALAYPDGFAVHAWHGTIVPSWVITDPEPERITAERNVEVRRCAIERISWDAYLDRIDATAVAVAPDPGNPGCELRLYDLPWQTSARLLLAVNGSVERDGTRRRYGLRVPAFDDPVAAAAWTYGMTATQYAGLRRRT